MQTLEVNSPFKHVSMNKGCLIVTKEARGDWILRVSEELAPHVQINNSDDRLDINVTREIPDTKVEINTKNLDSYTCTLGAGVMDVDAKLATFSKFCLGVGTLSAKLSHNCTGKVHGQVSTGVLKNDSELKVENHYNMGDNSTHADTSMFGKLSSGFVKTFKGGVTSGADNNIALIGEVYGIKSEYNVDTGTLNFLS